METKPAKVEVGQRWQNDTFGSIYRILESDQATQTCLITWEIGGDLETVQTGRKPWERFLNEGFTYLGGPTHPPVGAPRPLKATLCGHEVSSNRERCDACLAGLMGWKANGAAEAAVPVKAPACVYMGMQCGAPAVTLAGHCEKHERRWEAHVAYEQVTADIRTDRAAGMQSAPFLASQQSHSMSWGGVWGRAPTTPKPRYRYPEADIDADIPDAP